MTSLATLLLGGLLICAYSAQYWAKKCHDELRAIREQLDRR